MELIGVEVFSPEIQQQWKQMCTDLRSLQDFKSQRCMVPPGIIQTVQLFLFTEAYEQTYDAVTYARLTDPIVSQSHDWKTSSGSDQTVTFPHLELCETISKWYFRNKIMKFPY